MSATSLFWPVVRNLSGLSPGLIQEAGSAAGAESGDLDGQGLDPRTHRAGDQLLRQSLGSQIAGQHQGAIEDRLPTWDRRAWLRCEGAWAVPSPRGSPFFQVRTSVR